MTWQYEEMLRGNTYYGFVMDGIRVVSSRRELRSIVKRRNDSRKTAGGE